MIQIGDHVPRDAEAFVDMLVDEEPALMLEGPRGSGKSTLLNRIAAERNGIVLDLDDADTLAVLREDVTTPLMSPRLVVIDEFQKAPEVLSVVKRFVDRSDGEPGPVVGGSCGLR